MGFKILAINPGSTSTKIALYDDEQPTLALTLRHSAEEIARFPRIIDQLDWRKEMVLEALAKNNFDVKSLSAVIGRGGLIKPIESGVYEVNAALKNDLVNAQREHASNLGGLIAEQIAQAAGVKAYIADPVVVDELDDIARLSGIPECPRISIFHALNQKAIARRHAEKVGKRYEDLNLVVAHMGGGISVSAHCKGRVIDTNNALDGDGPIAPERAGTVPAGALVNLCFSGKYSQRDVLKMLAGKGGLVAHLKPELRATDLHRHRKGRPEIQSRARRDELQHRQGDRRDGCGSQRSGGCHPAYGRRGVQRTGERRNPRTLFVPRPDLHLSGRRRNGCVDAQRPECTARRKNPEGLRIIAFSVSGTRRYPNKFDMVSH